MNWINVLTTVATYGSLAVTAASAASASLPQTGPTWWLVTRKVIDVLAINLGNATNAPTK